MASIEKRTTNKGATSYRVKIRLRGTSPATATFGSLTKAQKWIKTTEAAIIEGRHFKTAEAKKHTLSELIDRYCRDVLPTKPKSQAKQQQQLTWWKSEIGNLVLADVIPAVIVECRDKLSNEITIRGEKRNPATVVRYMAALSHAFTVAVNEWQWLEDSPMRKVKKPKEPRGRVRFLSDDERNRLLAACKQSLNSHLYPIVILALATGMRQGEILGLKWKDLDLNQGFLILNETKNDERRRIPITGHVLETLKAYSKVRQIGTDLIFPGKNLQKPIDIRSPWGNALNTAQIDNFRFHDLRHSAASYLAMGGATLAEIAEVLGHKTLQMVKRYSHLSESHVSSVVSKMNARIFGGIE